MRAHTQSFESSKGSLFGQAKGYLIATSTGLSVSQAVIEAGEAISRARLQPLPGNCRGQQLFRCFTNPSCQVCIH
jgi:hypothetical protein